MSYFYKEHGSNAYSHEVGFHKNQKKLSVVYTDENKVGMFGQSSVSFGEKQTRAYRHKHVYNCGEIMIWTCCAVQGPGIMQSLGSP